MSSDNLTATAGASETSAGGDSVSASDAVTDSREKVWTVLELLTWTTDYFKKSGIDSARLDAEVLLAHALDVQRLRLYIDHEKPVKPEERDRFRSLVSRRAQQRVPVSQLLGEREFWSLSFKVSSEVLTPRPETETLVEWALTKVPGHGTHKKVNKSASLLVAEAAREAESAAADVATAVADGIVLPEEVANLDLDGSIGLGSAAAEAGSQSGSQVTDSAGTMRILDLGTGSGAIALSLASELPHAEITASDLSPAALQIAARNADELRTGERIRFVEGDLFAPLAKEKFDLIVSNPPYVARTDEGSLPPELAHEPDMALFSGADGLDVIRRLVAEAGDHLSPGGWLGIELSPEQVDEVEQELSQAGFVDVERRFDLASRPRVVGARKPNEND